MNSDAKDYVAIGLEYARGVVAGEIPACRWVVLACQRQIDDLARVDWEYTFDRKRANRICQFIELLPHIKGKWKSSNITLEPHQCFRLTTVFGWVDAAGNRRFRKSLIVLPRKNGKTTEAAGVALYGLALDGEPGAEVYAGAVTRDQVTGPSGVWTVAKKLVERSPGFQERYGVEALAHSIVVNESSSSFRPASRDAGSQEGFNTHFAIIDELHAHTTREVFDVIDESTGARQQPLLYIISTEGDNPAGVFAEQVNYGQMVLDKKHRDDSYFVIIYSIDPEDDWTSPASWAKANPNLGVSVFEKDLEIRCRQAEKNPSSQASFLCKRLNVRVGAGDAYFNMLAWNRCAEPDLRIEDFYGRRCFIILDLASKSDLAAKIQLFPGKRPAVFGKYYLPEESIEKGNPNYDFYRGWANQGLLTLTPGARIDYDFIQRDLLEDTSNFDLAEMPGVDPAGATQFITTMQKEGVELIEIPQRVTTLSDPMKELAASILAGEIQHDGDPILSWMMGNVIAKKDAKENVYPRKARDENKIDGAVALIGAWWRLIVVQDQSVSYTGLRAV